MHTLHPEQSVGKHRTDMWKFPVISMYEISQANSAITSLYTNKVHGYLIKNFMTKDEVDFALKQLSLLDPAANGEFSKNAGYSNPRSFSMLANERGINDELLTTYFTDLEKYNETLKKLFPFGYQERLFAFISKIENNLPVETPYIDVNNKRMQFTSSTIRVCFPGCGGMNTHVGNMFRHIYPNFYNFLDKLMDVDGQISYFVMLSKPEQGGQLVLFDARWGEFVSPNDEGEIIRANGEKVLQKELDYQLIDPQPGDMILFNGGDIWHKVDTLTGARDRITIGGFFAKTRDNQKIYGWA
jgi:hypothetical protein